MSDPAISGGSDAAIEPRSIWRSFLTSPAAPRRAMTVLELEGYLTGIIVAPNPIRPGLWMAGLWLDEQPVFDDAKQMQSVLTAVGALFNTLSSSIEQSLRRLEAERICDYRPAFCVTAGQPEHEAVTTWVRGFWKAMQLAPSDWSALVADERTQPIITSLVGFMENDNTIELADDIERRLDEAVEDIPRSILLLRKIAEIRGKRDRQPPTPRRAKIGRNDPCPCGSGQKFKRCCGQS